jgi:hypothetical protein
VKQWLTDSGRIPANKTRQHSKRLAMEKAIARFREIANGGSAEDISEAYIRLVIGRGVQSSQDKHEDKDNDKDKHGDRDDTSPT